MIINAVFHIDEKGKWKLVINNINNLLKDLKNYNIEIVANSEAVLEFVIDKSSYKNELRELSKKHVQICACQNALNGQNIKEEEIFNYIKIVPIGVKEVIEKQLSGYAYVKP